MNKFNAKELYGDGAECRVFKMQFRADDTNPREIVGYGAVFDSLSENLGGFREKIAPGAFDDVLDDDVRALINHDPSLILGRTDANTLAIAVDAVGLRYTVDMPDTSYANDLIVSLKRGDINQSSFAFNVDADTWDEDDDGRIIRTITKIKQLYDVSPVTYPGYPDTTVAARCLAQRTSAANAITRKRCADRRRRELDLITAAHPTTGH